MVQNDVEVVSCTLDKVVDRLHVPQIVVVNVNAQAEEQPGVPPVDDLVLSELRRRGDEGAVGKSEGGA